MSRKDRFLEWFEASRWMRRNRLQIMQMLYGRKQGAWLYWVAEVEGND